MPKILKNRPMPDWLKNLENLDYFPVDSVLKDSVYYPGCGRDGSIVREYNGYSHSFIYVDYWTEKKELLYTLKRYSFGGYDVEMYRELQKEELCYRSFVPYLPRVSDGYTDYVKEEQKNKIDKSYALWVILKRREKTDPGRGPERFSLVYIYGEGCATYQALYYSNQTAPSIVCVQTADEGCGGNWTNFKKKGGFFERVVLSNPYAKPQYLHNINPITEINCPWNEFTIPIVRNKSPCYPGYPRRKFIQLWERKSDNITII